jgi:hypothetical protein
MDPATRRAVALGAIGAPLLHSVTDLMEWLQGGFSPLQLWANYLAFLPIPAILIGLYAAQRPRISRWGLVGAVLYGFAFVFFTFTTLLAILGKVPSYADLWEQLGPLYTVHGALMIAGGLLFGSATLKAQVLPRWAPVLFLAGLGLNLLITFLPVADLYQTLGTTLRNAGLMGMGWAVWRRAPGVAVQA